MPSDHHLACPFCTGDDVTPFPDPTSAWSCLDCARVFRVEIAQPASVTGWGILRVVTPPRVPGAVAVETVQVGTLAVTAAA